MINQPPGLATKSLILILDHSCNKYCDLIGQEKVSSYRLRYKVIDFDNRQ